LLPEPVALELRARLVDVALAESTAVALLATLGEALLAEAVTDDVTEECLLVAREPLAAVGTEPWMA